MKRLTCVCFAFANLESRVLDEKAFPLAPDLRRGRAWPLDPPNLLGPLLSWPESNCMYAVPPYQACISRRCSSKVPATE